MAPPLPVLHPSFKKAYFEQAAWLPEWIEIAEGLVRKRFDAKYADLPMPDELDDDEAVQGDDEGNDAPKAPRASAV